MPTTPSSTSTAAGPSPSGAGASLLRHSSPEVREAYAKWRAGGDAAAADAVVLAVIRDHIPEKSRRANWVPAESQGLAADLGFDSMAVTEMVFAFEDLFEVTIRNAEIVDLRTVGDLRAFVRRRLASRPAGTGAPPA